MIIKHASVGSQLTEAEWTADETHVVDGSSDYDLALAGGINIFVASSAATAAEKAMATSTYTCLGDNTDSTVINAGLAALT